MRNTYLGLFLIALTTLMLELTLIRVFDVLWYPNMAYMVITLAMFCFALSGVYASLRSRVHSRTPDRDLAIMAAAYGVLALAILPLMNSLPFEFDLVFREPLVGMAWLRCRFS